MALGVLVPDVVERGRYRARSAVDRRAGAVVADGVAVQHRAVLNDLALGHLQRKGAHAKGLAAVREVLHRPRGNGAPVVPLEEVVVDGQRAGAAKVDERVRVGAVEGAVEEHEARGVRFRLSE
eukprot:3070552-Prymnesium_polylepis.2